MKTPRQQRDAVDAAIKKHIDKCDPRRRLEAELEMRIATAVIRDALAYGFSVTVYDGEEEALQKSLDMVAIIDAIFSTDEDRLIMHRPGGRPQGEGWILLIWGNGADLISDYTTNLPASLFTKANEIADYYQ